ncbi:hypothetical protein [Aurantimicrobium minutum]|uniref:hypothetical protein n=1 Tax=Aurantimicrobium minutum TaxID=708131 RepID=UPI002474B989|nr:hypothetical protein [Aurantimicrobium minutum]MDH6255315.1 hypothetical protein [Aurantimicrobium minutum]
MRVKPLIAIPLIAIALAGCSAQPPAPKEATAAPEQKPLFATDAEALAAAEAAYANYLEVSDQIARDGGANPERLKGLVSDELLKSQYSSYENAALSKLKASGSSTFYNFKLQQFKPGQLSNYVCLDVSGIRVLDESGLDATPADRPNLLPLSLSWLQKGNQIVLESSDVWTGENFCG